MEDAAGPLMRAAEAISAAMGLGTTATGEGEPLGLV
jgi:hypothetical protein